MALDEILSPILTDLYFPSESDEPVEYIKIETDESLPLSIEAFKAVMEISDKTTVEPLDVDGFWKRVTTVKEWFEEEQIEMVKKFESLQNTLFENLTEIQGFRVGEVEIDIYLFGKNTEGGIEGIKTKSIES